MAALPTVGGDDGTWGTILNAFLSISHNSDGTMKVPAATIFVAASDANAAVRAVTPAAYLCDGTADNVQIQAAIDALPSGGGKVVLSEGTFNIAATVALDSYTTLSGQGRSTILKAATNLNDEIVGLTGVAVEQITLMGFNVDGNKANQSTSGIGILIDNTGTLFTFTHTDPHNHIEDILIYDCKDDGLKLYGANGTGDGPRGTYVHGVTVYTCDGNGINLQASDCQLVQCVSGKNGLRGVIVGPNAASSMLTNVKAFGSGQLTAASGQGFKTTSSRVQFANCQAQDNKDAGFEVSGGDHVYSGCVADSNGVTTSRRPGFDVTNLGDRDRFVGCSAVDRNAGEARKQSYGIVIASGALNLNWVGGGFYNNYTGPVSSAEATAKIVAAEGYAPVFATGASHTVDELITYLQGLGLAAQS